MKIDPELYSYCTDRQREVLEAYEEHGTGPAAAEALGGTDRTYPDKVLRDVRKKAAREGYAPIAAMFKEHLAILGHGRALPRVGSTAVAIAPALTHLNADFWFTGHR